MTQQTPTDEGLLTQPRQTIYTVEQTLGVLENIHFLALPYSVDANAEVRNSEIQRISTRECFSHREREKLSQSLSGLCGATFSGKSTIARIWRDRIWPGAIAILPEARVATQRQLRPGEIEGEDIVFYPDEASFLDAVNKKELLAAWYFQRDQGLAPQLAGIRIEDLRRVIAHGQEKKNILITNGPVCLALMQAFEGMTAFWVDVLPEDRVAFQLNRGIPVNEGKNMGGYGTLVREPMRLAGIKRLPNRRVTDPEAELVPRFQDPYVRSFLERDLFWVRYVRNTVKYNKKHRQIAIPDDEDTYGWLPLEYVEAVLEGTIPPSSHHKLMWHKKWHSEQTGM